MTVSVSFSLLLRQLFFAASVIFCASACHALVDSKEPSSTKDVSVALPDAPSASASFRSNSAMESDAFGSQTTNAGGKPMASPYQKFIAAGQPAPPLEARDKMLLGLRESITPLSMVGWIASAGFTQLIDSSPNYGTNGKAFAQRLGAAAALNSSRKIFSDSLLATAFHQDPRYYQLGHSHSFVNRVAYAATRTVVGRTDGGRTIPNYATILGTGGSSALTRTYYPERNGTSSQIMQTWATSLGGTALGYLAFEFGDDILSWLHVRKHE